MTPWEKQAKKAWKAHLKEVRERWGKIGGVPSPRQVRHLQKLLRENQCRNFIDYCRKNYLNPGLAFKHL